MYHYAYLLEFEDGKKYVGAKSSNVKPDLDTTYLGSGKALPKDRHNNRDLVTKTILGVFETRQELLAYEESYIINYDCVNSDDYLNLRQRVYDKQGKGHASCGFTKESREQGRITKKNRNYTKGANRTAAQLAHDKWCSENFAGVKNPDKGHVGTDNSAFVPWYYIDPQGNYVEVHDTTKTDKAPELGFTPRQLGHAFHHTNQHKKSNRLPRKGWTFGNLPRPKQTDE